MRRKRVLNTKGFTLIELLAVIVIMGILMMVAIPAMTTFMENARKDTFINFAQSYINAARYKVVNDDYLCGTYSSSALVPGVYYIVIDDKGDDGLLEDPAQSPWGTPNLQGYIRLDVTSNSTTKTTDVAYSISLGESRSSGSRRSLASNSEASTATYIGEKELDRGKISSTVSSSISVPSGATTCAAQY